MLLTLDFDINADTMSEQIWIGYNVTEEGWFTLGLFDTYSICWGEDLDFPLPDNYKLN